MEANERKLPTQSSHRGNGKEASLLYILTGYVTWAKALDLSEPHFSHLQNRGKGAPLQHIQGANTHRAQAQRLAEPNSDKRKLMFPSLPAGRHL